MQILNIEHKHNNLFEMHTVKIFYLEQHSFLQCLLGREGKASDHYILKFL